MNNLKKGRKHIIFPLLCQHPSLTLQHPTGPIISSPFQGTTASLLIWNPWSGIFFFFFWRCRLYYRRADVPIHFSCQGELLWTWHTRWAPPDSPCCPVSLVKPLGKPAPQTCLCLTHLMAHQLLFGLGCVQGRWHLKTRTHFVKLSGTCRATAEENTHNRFWQVSLNKATGGSGDQT